MFFTPLDPDGDEAEEEFNNDSSRPIKVHFYSKWKPHQDGVYWIHLARAQEKGLQFWQTKSRAIVLCDSVPPHCSEKMVCLQGDKILCQRIPTPRPALKIVLKDAWQVEQGTLSSKETSTVEGNLFQIDLRIQKTSSKYSTSRPRKNDQDSRIGEQAQNGIPNRICHHRLG